MFCQAGFDPWLTTLMQHLAPLSTPQAPGLALWSCGMVRARSCALSAGSHLLATGMRRNEQTGRQRRRAWYDAGPRTRGPQRPALRVETCFAPWLGGVGSWWQGTPRALALEATAVGARVVVWTVSVVDRGGALPVAWGVLPATTKQAWRREGLRLLRLLRPALPRPGTVSVLADRGVSAPWLLRRLVTLGGPPCVRLHSGGPFRPASPPGWRPLTTFAPQPGPRWRGRGTALQQAGRQLECPLVALGEDDYQDPWLRLTALPPEARDAAW